MTGRVAATGGGTPPPGSAIDHAPTREALRVHAHHPLWFLGAALVGLVVSGLLAVAGASDSVWLFPLGFAIAGPVLAVWFTVRWWSMRTTLRTSPWVGRRGRHHVTGWGKYRQATILLEADEHGPELM